MAAVDKSIVIKAPPEKIWDNVKHPSGWPKWFEGASTPKSVDGDGDVGTTVELTMSVANLPLPSRLTVSEIDPGKLWRGDFESPGLAEGHMLFTYMPMGPRTKLSFHIEADLKGAAKVAEGMVARSFADMADKTLQNVKVMAEE